MVSHIEKQSNVVETHTSTAIVSLYLGTSAAKWDRHYVQMLTIAVDVCVTTTLLCVSMCETIQP